MASAPFVDSVAQELIPGAREPHRERGGGAGFARCPSCHTTDPFVTNDALSTGSDWTCERCGGQWSATRLTAAAGYAVWLSDRNNLAKGTP